MPRKHVLVKGRVQGIGFRWFARETAELLGVDGWVRNLADGSVEAEAEASEEALGRFLEALRRGPSGARVEVVQVTEVRERREEGFEIRF
jgi:acylphosphatase